MVDAEFVRIWVIGRRALACDSDFAGLADVPGSVRVPPDGDIGSPVAVVVVLDRFIAGLFPGYGLRLEV